jgi:atypical dual specificity phosphatase
MVDFLNINSGHPKQLYKLGVRGVVNLCSEYNGPIDNYSELSMRQLWLPTVDHFESTTEQLIEAVKFIDQYKQRGEKVMILITNSFSLAY